MTMDVIPIRIPKGLVKEIDSLVEKGDYSNRSDVVRYAIRKLVWKGSWEETWKDEIGSIPDTGDSVKEVRKIRKILSKQPIDLDEINES